jgi:hypothetical protein
MPTVRSSQSTSPRAAGRRSPASWRSPLLPSLACWRGSSPDRPPGSRRALGTLPRVIASALAWPVRRRSECAPSHESSRSHVPTAPSRPRDPTAPGCLHAPVARARPSARVAVLLRRPRTREARSSPCPHRARRPPGRKKPVSRPRNRIFSSQISTLPPLRRHSIGSTPLRAGVVLVL